MTDSRRIAPALAGAIAALLAWSAPAAQTHPERFEGERRLQSIVLAQDRAVPRLLLDEADPSGPHGRFVAQLALAWGLPRPSLDVGPLARHPGPYAVISQAHSGAATLEPKDLAAVRASTAIVVAGAGNPGEGRAQGAHATTDYLTPSHPHWDGPQGRAWWRRARSLMQSGALIIARASRPTASGWEPDTSVHCGETAPWCYTIRAHPEGLGEASTSSAATLLASYLTSLAAVEPDDPVRILQACTVDIGPPGIDPVFGRGLVTANCPELDAALKQLETDDQAPPTGNT